MKYLITVLLSVSVACTYGEHSQLSKEVLSKIDWQRLIADVNKEIKEFRSGFIQADLTNFTLEFLGNIGDYLDGTDFDPLKLSDEKIDLFPGSLKITNGSLNGIHTILATDKVFLKYTHDTDILELTLPLGFNSFVIKYNYKVQVLLVSVSGTITATVKDLKLHLHLGYNFTESHAFVDKVDVKNSGSITFHFTGLGLLDYIIDLMTNVLTTLFHGIILAVADAVIYNPVADVVDSINQAIDSILYPNSTTLLMNYGL